jgi:hypothetical protein
MNSFDLRCTLDASFGPRRHEGRQHGAIFSRKRPLYILWAALTRSAWSAAACHSFLTKVEGRALSESAPKLAHSASLNLASYRVEYVRS